jgi:pre-mRNA-splicing helicase BRR2
MCGKACKGDLAGQGQETSGGGLSDEGMARCLLLCPTQKKEFYKKFLYEGLPIESQLDTHLHNHFNAEIVSKTIENKQDAVDWLTWTYLYRRMAQNPNYYNLTGVTHQHLSDHLSEVVETTLNDLVASKCVAVDEDDMDVSPLNLGMIAAYYYINYVTIEIFSMSLTSGTKLRGLLEIISSAAEFETLVIRKNEDKLLAKIYDRCPVKLGSGTPKFTDPHVKTNIMLQSHFSRLQLPVDLMSDLNEIIMSRIISLIYASVDVLSSNGWLSPAVAAMELSQMIVQAMWGDRESPLRQLPHFDQHRIQSAKDAGIETIFDFMEVDDNVRDRVLEGLSQGQIAEVAKVVNRYPNIEVGFTLTKEDEEEEEAEGSEEEMKQITVATGESVNVNIVLSREDEDEEMAEGEGAASVGPVIAPFFPKPKDENWWLVVGQPDSKQLHSIKRLTLQRQYQCTLEFTAPNEPGEYTFKLLFMCDSWVGCDQEYEFIVRVEQGMDVDEQGESDGGR